MNDDFKKGNKLRYVFTTCEAFKEVTLIDRVCTYVRDIKHQNRNGLCIQRSLVMFKGNTNPSSVLKFRLSKETRWKY